MLEHCAYLTAEYGAGDCSLLMVDTIMFLAGSLLKVNSLLATKFAALDGYHMYTATHWEETPFLHLSHFESFAISKGVRSRLCL